MPKLTGVEKSGLDVGFLIPVAQGQEIPAGTLLCNGASLLKADYPLLYARIGDRWGSADADHFNLPDLRGYMIRGRDRASGRDVGAASRGNGATGNGTGQTGQATGDAVGSVQDDTVQGHLHDHNIRVAADGAGSGSLSSGNTDVGINSFRGQFGASSDSVANMSGFGTVRVTSETRDKNVYVRWAIPYI